MVSTVAAVVNEVVVPAVADVSVDVDAMTAAAAAAVPAAAAASGFVVVVVVVDDTFFSAVRRENA